MLKYLITFLICCSVAVATTFFKVPNNFDKSSKSYWDNLIYQIEHTEDDIVLLWEGHGGRVDLAENVMKRIGTLNKKILIKIVGPSISMHAIVVCNLPNLVEFNQSVIILHNVFTGTTGHKNFSDSETRRLLNVCIRSGVVTEEDADRIINQKQRVEIYPDGKKIFKEDWK